MRIEIVKENTGSRHPNPDSLARAQRIFDQENRASKHDAQQKKAARELEKAKQLASEYGLHTFLQLPFVEQAKQWQLITDGDADNRISKGDVFSSRCYDSAPEWNAKNGINIVERITHSRDAHYAELARESQRPFC